MTDKASLIALKERVDAADGPSYALDTAIALHTGFWPAERVDYTTGSMSEGLTVWFTDGPELPLPPNVTASVDAALALVERVLPGWEWGVRNSGTSFVCNEALAAYQYTERATPCLSILSALLAALIAEGA